jgi:hypothetical protein
MTRRTNKVYLIVYLFILHSTILKEICAGVLCYLATAPTVMLSADDCEGGLTGDAGVTFLIRNPVWGVYRGKA